RPGVPCPEEMPRARAERVQGAVRVPDVHAPVGERRRRVEVLAAVEEAGVRSGAPANASGPSVERVHLTAVRPDVHRAARICGGAVHLGAQIDTPAQAWVRALPHVERVKMVIPRAEVENAVDQQGRRLDGAGLVAPEDLAAMEEDPASFRAEEDGDDESLLRAWKPVA